MDELEVTDDNHEVHYVFEDNEFTPESAEISLDHEYYEDVILADGQQVFEHEGNYYAFDASNEVLLTPKIEENIEAYEIQNESQIEDKDNIIFEYANSNDSENVVYNIVDDKVDETYQFAVIKNGKLILQKEINENVNDCDDIEENLEILDFNKITGKNLVTGQSVTLDGYFNNELQPKNKVYDDVLNKKIDLGVNSKGKKLFGKILDIKKGDKRNHKSIDVNLEDPFNRILPIINDEHYEIISRTLIGLLDMESVNGNLLDKPLHIKLVEMSQNNVSVILVQGYLHDEEDEPYFIMFNKCKQVQDEREIELRKISMFRLRFICPTGLKITRSIDEEGNEQPTKVVFTANSKYSNSCIVCPVQLKSIKSLRRHYITQHPSFKDPSSEDAKPESENSAAFECVTCNRFFAKKSSLKRHNAVHDEDLCMFQCSVCKMRFYDNSTMRKHLLIHAGLKPHACDVCKRSFTNSGDLTTHKRTHKKRRSGGANHTYLYACKICGHGFSRFSNMNRHAQIHVRGNFECPICECNYQFSSSLTRHMIANHIVLSNHQTNHAQTVKE